MHRCLSLPDILDQVMLHIDPASQSLAHIALTCRGWFAPAMRVQWASLEDLTPLILLLPVRVDVATSSAMPAGLDQLESYTFPDWAALHHPCIDGLDSEHAYNCVDRRPAVYLPFTPRNVDWDRFDTYASWVRTLGIPIDRKHKKNNYISPRYYVGVAVWNALDSHLKGSKHGTLFLGLQTLRWTTGLTPPSFHYLLSAPGVRSLQINASYGMQAEHLANSTNDCLSKPITGLKDLLTCVLGLFSRPSQSSLSQLTSLAFEQSSSEDPTGTTIILSIIFEGRMPALCHLLLGINLLPETNPCKRCKRNGWQCTLDNRKPCRCPQHEHTVGKTTKRSNRTFRLFRAPAWPPKETKSKNESRGGACKMCKASKLRCIRPEDPTWREDTRAVMHALGDICGFQAPHESNERTGTVLVSTLLSGAPRLERLFVGVRGNGFLWEKET